MVSDIQTILMKYFTSLIVHFEFKGMEVDTIILYFSVKN